MKNQNKLLLLLLIVTVVLVLVGYILHATNVAEVEEKNPLSLNEDKTDLNHNTTEVDASPENKAEVDTNLGPEALYFFVSWLGWPLLGSYDDNGWHSFCDSSEMVPKNAFKKTAKFYVKDLLNQDCYYVYDRTKFLGEAKTVSLYTFFEPEDVVKLAKYSLNPIDEDYLTFKLPVKLGDELSNLEMPWHDMATIIDFGIDGVLVTNSAGNLFPREITYGVEPTPEGERALLALFKENNMENTVPNFTECVRCDFNGDGKEEYLMVANTPMDDYGPIIAGAGENDKLGTFSVVLYQNKNGNVQVLNSITVPLAEDVKFGEDGRFIEAHLDHYHNMELSIIADLNNDGIMEIIFSSGIWDCGWYFAYTQNEQGKYTVVMGTDWG